jgi:hypothetical protein
MSNFDDFEDDDTLMAKEALKEMLVSEIVKTSKQASKCCKN